MSISGSESLRRVQIDRHTSLPSLSSSALVSPELDVDALPPPPEFELEPLQRPRRAHHTVAMAAGGAKVEAPGKTRSALSGCGGLLSVRRGRSRLSRRKTVIVGGALHSILLSIIIIKFVV